MRLLKVSAKSLLIIDIPERALPKVLIRTRSLYTLISQVIGYFFESILIRSPVASEGRST